MGGECWDVENVCMNAKTKIEHIAFNTVLYNDGTFLATMGHNEWEMAAICSTTSVMGENCSLLMGEQWLNNGWKNMYHRQYRGNCCRRVTTMLVQNMCLQWLPTGLRSHWQALALYTHSPPKLFCCYKKLYYFWPKWQPLLVATVDAWSTTAVATVPNGRHEGSNRNGHSSSMKMAVAIGICCHCGTFLALIIF